MTVKLDTRPSRPLTTREVTKLLCGVLGALHGDTAWPVLSDAIEWLHAHKEDLRSLFAANQLSIDELLARARKMVTHDC